VLIKTKGLALFYDMPLYELMLWRLVNYIIVGVLEGIILCLLIKNKSIRSYLRISRKGYNT
jgi:hypothetical protein